MLNVWTSELWCGRMNFINTRLLVQKQVQISVAEWILETTRPQKSVRFLEQYTI